MNSAAVEKIARAVLYEGYLLYPYRRSSVKNRQRWTFGALYPPSFCEDNGEAKAMETQVLVRGSTSALLEVRVRFLQLAEAGAGPADTWQEASEREVSLPALRLGELLALPSSIAFGFPAPAHGIGASLDGVIELSAEHCGEGLVRATVRIRNTTPFHDDSREEALLRAFISTHTVVGVRGGELVSLLEPPDDARAAAAECTNLGTWPVLVGVPGERDTMLSSPIILYDYPTIAKESPGDLFDATEIDEILTLRILTLTEDEKRQMSEADPRARALLERTEALSSAELLNLHGRLRAADAPPQEAAGLRAGDHVRLKPRPGGDVFDLVLAGKAATVESIQEVEGGDVFVAVAVDEDPGKDFGLAGQPGHRFFYRLDEVERLP
jgi:hypothetical protein